MGYEELIEAFPAVAPRGIEGEVLDQLTNVFKYRVNHNNKSEAGAGGDDDEASEPSCAICLATFEDGDEIRMLPCLHQYHKACADQWLANHTSCPVCKTDIKTLVSEIPKITGDPDSPHTLPSLPPLFPLPSLPLLLPQCIKRDCIKRD
jgi:hypothetical protein